MKAATSILIIVSCTSCAAPSKVHNPDNWDLDGNDRLSRYEFVTGYAESNYFRSWCRCDKLTPKKFYEAIFEKLDRNHDGILTDSEFARHTKYFNLKTPSASFSVSDAGTGEVMGKNDFISNLENTSLFSQWDASKDGWISQEELAQVMFLTSDLNNDQVLNSLEFNIWKVNR